MKRRDTSTIDLFNPRDGSSEPGNGRLDTSSRPSTYLEDLPSEWLIYAWNPAKVRQLAEERRLRQEAADARRRQIEYWKARRKKNKR